RTKADVVRFFAAGRRAPHLASRRAPYHHRPDQAFLDELISLGGTSKDVQASRELLELILPTLRADVELCETYAYAPSAPLSCAISALGGLNDVDVNRDSPASWRRQTRGDSRSHLSPGHPLFVS